MIKTCALMLMALFLSGCVGTATQISCMFDPPAEPEPTVTSGQFKVNLEYIEKGEKKLIADTVRCKYLGRVCDGRGLHNDWSYSLESGRERLVIKNLGKDEYLYKATGSCKQFMAGDLTDNKSASLYYREGTWNVNKFIEPSTLLNEYGIEIVVFHIEKTP